MWRNFTLSGVDRRRAKHGIKTGERAPPVSRSEGNAPSFCVSARLSQHAHRLLIMDTFFSITPAIPAESSVETLGELLADQEHGGTTTGHSGCVLA
ncbi:hypothetical protein C8Q74DRAFT_354723 [Fomes fomentarius]|nr:hypothetical protein C8Q74DRAFT_354723 [Fomes fomentarius]